MKILNMAFPCGFGSTYFLLLSIPFLERIVMNQSISVYLLTHYYWKPFLCEALCYTWGYYVKQDRAGPTVMALQALCACLPFSLQPMVIMNLFQPFHWINFALDLFITNASRLFSTCLLICFSCALRYLPFLLTFSTLNVCNPKHTLVLFLTLSSQCLSRHSSGFWYCPHSTSFLIILWLQLLTNIRLLY